ncbi:mismatch-specific DNA-glycosylase [Streptomyces sp. NPDC060011]|uniref:mismatch-specific DNA-glycosylase n=1 Tax=Streptomyces sp. NPDC060011 TaxID=3347037 RepID=UPI0036949B14
MGFSRAELEGFRGGSLPDLLGPRTRLLFVGVNPGLSAVAVQAPFPSRTNRFYPALYRAGITDRLIDASSGFVPGDRDYLLERGVGITALVPKATARADELAAAELVAGAEALTETVERVEPHVVAVLGITAFRVAFAMPKARVGRQPGLFAGAQLWVVPNPSGLNAHSSLADLAVAYREAAVAAGIELAPTAP